MGLKKDVKPRPHQQRAVDRLLKSNGNLIMAHDVGTGKTLTSIMGFEALKKRGKAKRALVVVPASLKRNFIEDGVRKFTNDSYLVLGNKQEASQGDPRTKSIEQVSPGKAATYNVVSYDMFKKDPDKYLDKTKADTVIYDELHRAKNETSKITDVIKNIRGKHRNFIGLTGSVVSNSPADLVPLVDAMTDGKHFLGNKESFESRFLNVDNRGRKTIKNLPVLKTLAGKYIDFVDRDDLKSAKPPAREYRIHDVVMSPVQGDLYRYAIDKLDPLTKAKLKIGVGKLSDSDVRKIGNKMMGMRQISNAPHTAVEKMSLEESYRHSPKVQKLIKNVKNHLNSTKDGQVIIGTQFIKGGVDILTHALNKEKIPHGVFIGKGNKGITEKTRNKAVDDYNSGKNKVIILTAAGGEGINLPNTTEVHLLDGHFNPEAISQLEARGIRAGGLSHRDEKDRKVTIHKYRSVQDRKVSTVLSNIYGMVNPIEYIKRSLNDEPIFINPADRGLSADMWINDVADSKAKNNTALKNSLRKTAAQLITPENKVMEEYYNRFGKDIGDVIGTGNFINKKEEEAFIDRLREGYKQTVNAKEYINIGGRTSSLSNNQGLNVFSLKDFDDKGKLRLSSFADPRKNLALYIPIAAAGTHLAMHNHKGARAQLTPILLGSTLSAGLLARQRYTSKYGTLSKAEARKKLKLSDEDLLKMLRGENIAKEEILRQNYALK